MPFSTAEEKNVDSYHDILQHFYHNELHGVSANNVPSKTDNKQHPRLDFLVNNASLNVRHRNAQC